MNLEKLGKCWDKLGEDDPWWTTLAYRGKRGQWDPEEFFATGREQIESLMLWLRHNNVSVERNDALDFGCGPGRLTQALAEHFRHVTGVDVAPSMIRHANDLNPLDDQCSFVLNTEPDLRVFEDNSFDFVCSIIVLQLMEPRYMRAYLREFSRIVRPGGAIAVQIAESPIGKWSGSLRRLFANRWTQPILNTYRRIKHKLPAPIEMYGMKREQVKQLLTDCGLHVVRVSKCSSAGPNWTSFRYLAVREAVHENLDECFETLESGKHRAVQPQAEPADF